MPAANTPTAYGTVSRTFHWLTALLILAAFPLGVIASDAPYATAEELARKAQLFSLHKTLGVAVFAVALARILWALGQTHPAPLHPQRRAETLAAATVHWALYLSLVVVPLSGWVHHAALDGFAPILWPLGQGLPFVPKSETVAAAAGAVHWLFTTVMFAAIALHVLGALKHVVIDRDGTLARMTRGTPAGTGSAAPAPLAPALALAIFAAGGLAAWAMVPAAPEAAAPAAAPAAPAAATAGNWQVTDGTLAFTVAQMGAPVEGRFAGWTADIAYDEATGTGSVTVVIDTTTLTLGAVTDQAKGADFLNVPAHPQATFSATIAPGPQGHAASGTLTLAGTARPVTLPFTLTITGDTAAMTGSVTLDRRDFALGSGFADETQVGFAVTVTVTLTAQRAG
jgi:cytochrome b561/polyisoprenoid-binding protein YceI